MRLLGITAVLLSGIAGTRAADPPAAETAVPLALAPGPHLFLDDRLIARAAGLTRRVASPARQLPGPVVTGPEDRCFQPYVTVLRDPDSRRFRMWYGVPESASQSHLAYIESADGVRWQRPHRVLADPGRIDFGASIIDDGPREKDPARRYKYGWWNAGGLQVAASPDGLNWKPLAPGVVLRHNHDINSIHWDPIRGHYIAMVSSYGPGGAWKGNRRHTFQSVSRDLLRWEAPWPVVTPDDSVDPGETQFYCMSGLLARGQTLVGMLKVLRDDLPADPGGPVAGIGYTTLAWSHDGRTWTRDREAFFDRDPRPGAWDHAMAWIDCQLPLGDELFLYYGGYARGHKVDRFTERQIGLLRIPRDRYVAREAGAAGGTLLTPPVLIQGERLALNVDARDGEARVQIETPEGKPLPGYGFDDAAAVTVDSLAAPLRWKRSLAALRGRPVRLAIRLRRARLYALEVGSGRN